MAQYSISWSDPRITGKNTPIIVPEKIIDSTSTSLVLTGKGVTNYGEIQQTNFLHLLENFASDDPPARSTIGQLWFDTQNRNLKVKISSTIWEAVSPIPSQTGNSGKILSTNGGTMAWITPAAGNAGSVTSVAASGGSTGLVFSGSPITSSGTLTLSGTLAILNGGTGATTADAALSNLLPSQSGNAGKVLVTNGSSASWAEIAGGGGGTVYTLPNASTTVLGGIKVGAGLVIDSSGVLSATGVGGGGGGFSVIQGTNPISVTTSGSTATVSLGTVGIANGGTGQTTAAAAINALLPSQASANGKVLSSNGSGVFWAAAAGFGNLLDSPNGYITLPGNILVQWGILAMPGGSNVVNQRLNFQQQFAMTYVVTGSADRRANSGWNTAVCVFENISSSGADVAVDTSDPGIAIDGGLNVRWIAVGSADPAKASNGGGGGGGGGSSGTAPFNLSYSGGFQPADLTDVGSQAYSNLSLTGAASGTSPLTYTWNYSYLDRSSGITISGSQQGQQLYLTNIDNTYVDAVDVTLNVSNAAGQQSYSNTTGNPYYIGGGQQGGGGECLIRGTMVMLPDGTEIAIEDVKAGMVLKSFNMNGLPQNITTDSPLSTWELPKITGGMGVSTVIRNGAFTAPTYIDINGGLIKFTPNHRHLVKPAALGKWVFKNAEDVIVGDLMMNSQLQETPVISVQVINGPVTAFEIDVGASDILFAGGMMTHDAVSQD